MYFYKRMRNTGFQALAAQVAKGQQGARHSCASLAAPCPLPKENSLLFLPPCAGSEHHAVCPLPVRMSNRLAQHPCLKHWSNMGAVQQLGSRFLGEAVTQLPLRHPSVPSLSCPWHADTSTHVFNAQSQKNVMKFVCIPHGLT